MSRKKSAEIYYFFHTIKFLTDQICRLKETARNQIQKIRNFIFEKKNHFDPYLSKMKLQKTMLL